MSLEAFGMMYAINNRYPRRKAGQHGVKRVAQDLRPLKFLPGQPFQIEGFTDSKLGRLIYEEGKWLERELGFTFPEMRARALAPMWQDETLECIEETVNKLKEPALREAVAAHLDEVVKKLRWRDLSRAATLAWIAVLIRQSLTDEGARERRKALRRQPESIEDIKSYALPWYKDKLVQDYPILKLPLAVKRLFARA